MSFLSEVRKVSIPGKKPRLSELEKGGDPEALAAAFSNFNREKEVQPISVPRASSLYDACMRKHVIGTKFDLVEPHWINLRAKLIFGIGNAVHDKIQNSDILFGENRYGWWKCLGCGVTRYFGAPPKRPCEKCGARAEATIYLEHAMMLRKPLMVRGHPDIFFKVIFAKTKLLRVAELKTLTGDEYDKLVAPIIDNVWQITTYMWGCSIDKSLPVSIDPNLGYIVYVTKKQTKDVFPLKIFPVLYDADLLKRIKAKLGLYKKGLDDYPKNLPAPVEECERSRFDGYRARTCPALIECKKRPR